MNKTELTREVCSRLELTGQAKKAAGEIVDTLFQVIADAMVDGQDVTVANFGKLSPRVRAAREARNPRTGEKMQIPEKKQVRFSMYEHLNKSLNGGV